MSYPASLLGKLNQPTRTELPAAGINRAISVLKALFDCNAAVGVVAGDAISAYVISGVTYLDKTTIRSFDEFIGRVQTNMVGSSAKLGAGGLKAAGQPLAATLTNGMYGAVVTVATPILQARPARLTLTLTWTIDGLPVAQVVDVYPKAVEGSLSPVWQFVALSLSNNGGLGTPAKATALSVSCADGQPSLVDLQSALTIESLNLRDIK
jgi:hypothetical protein